MEQAWSEEKFVEMFEEKPERARTI